MRTFKNFKVLAAMLLAAAASWAQPQISGMDGLKSQIDAFNAGSADMAIAISADFDISSPLEINNDGYNLTIQSFGAQPRTLTRAAIGNLFTINKGSLTLQNITIDGSNNNSPYLTNAHGSLVFVGDGGTLNMQSGATLQNNTIRDNNGSGVYVDSRGAFNMAGGTIKGNKTNLSGGGVYIYALRAVFNMSGGIITENSCGTSATSYSGGVHFANTAFATDADPDKTPSVFRLGGVAVIKNNTKGNGSSSDVYMAGSRYITLGDGANGAPPPADGMEVWITKVAEKGLFVNKGAKAPNPPDDPFGDAKYFQADAGSQVVYEETGKLTMVSGYDMSLNPSYLKFMEIFDYSAQPQREITVTNIGGRIGRLAIYLSGEDADNFELDLTNISSGGMTQYETQTFTIKPKLGLKAGTYSAFVLVSAPESINGDDGGPVIMRRLDVEFMVREYIEDRALYFNQSDGRFYASSMYTEIGSLPAPSIFALSNAINIPATWDPETSTLKLYGVDWATTAPYALYFSQLTPLTLELAGDNSFVSSIAANPESNSAGIVSRSSLTITGDGSLEAKGANASEGSYGIFSLALAINGGVLIASGETTAMEIEKDVVLRTPPSQYEWWYANEATKGSGAFIYDPDYKWIKIKVPQPKYVLEASADNSEPPVNAEIEITLAVKDITTGGTYASISGEHPVDLTGVELADFGIEGSNPILAQFAGGIGKLILKPQKPGKQVLWFNMENPDYPAVNPLAITPVSASAPPPSISIHPGNPSTFDAIQSYPPHTSLNVVVENTGSRPTGELTVGLGGKDSASFTLSSGKVATIAAGGSAIFRVVPILGLGINTYTVAVIIKGNGIEEELTVHFTVKKEHCVPFDEIAVALWGNNTLTVINNPANNGVSSSFSDFIWFKDGQEVGAGQSLSEYEYGGQLMPGKYHVEMKNEYSKFISCEYEIPKPGIAAKSPAIDFSEVETVDVYSASGKFLARLNAQGSFPAEIRSIKNAYALALKSKTGARKIIRAAEALK